MNDNAKIIGGHGKRRERDFYPTPKECVYSLMEQLKLPKETAIWECACGDGAIINALGDLGYLNVRGTDVQTGTDFLLQNDKGNAEWIITNPPFFLAENFIRHAHFLECSFAFLLKSQYWHSVRRKQLFDEMPPNYIFPLTWRPDFTGQKCSLMDMMWCIWTSEAQPTIYRPIKKVTLNV